MVVGSTSAATASEIGKSEVTGHSGFDKTRVTELLTKQSILSWVPWRVTSVAMLQSGLSKSVQNAGPSKSVQNAGPSKSVQNTLTTTSEEAGPKPADQVQPRPSHIMVAKAKVMGCCEKIRTYLLRPMTGLVLLISRLILTVVNICLLFFSGTVIALGIVVLSRSWFIGTWIDSIEESVNEEMNGLGLHYMFEVSMLADVLDRLAYGLICFGGILAIISLLGCIGVALMDKAVLIIYGDTCLIILIAKILLTVFIYSQESIGKPEMLNSLKSYSGMLGKDPITIGWNIMMKYLHCCGVDSHHDFSHLEQWPPNLSRDKIFNLKTPVVCCKGNPKNFSCAEIMAATPENNNMDVGCYQTIFNFVFHNHLTISLIVILFLFESVVIFVASWILFHIDRRD